MLNTKLLQPNSIAVIGASDNKQTPGGKVLFNLISNGYQGKLYGVNPKLDLVQNIPCFNDVSLLPEVDMAIIAVAAKYCTEIVKVLTETKNTKAFIIFSAGFSELDEEGKKMENDIVRLIDTVNGTLLGPNNIGMFNTNFAGVFTTPIPKLDSKGVDFISGSGATAVFIMEAAIPKGLTFNSVFSVGNSAQIGVEEVLQHLDETYVHGVSSAIKLLYIESIQNPQKLLFHALSLRNKGARIAAIKAGSSEAGSRAASSHTGAMANVDTAVNALFEKAGIIRCHSREELVNVAGVLTYPELKGKNIAIVTHAGGPAVMLTDALSKNGLLVPKIINEKSKDLLKGLFAGSSVANPIDFLATGTAEQLDLILDYCINVFEEIDAIAVIFGSPGLFQVDEVYELLHNRISSSTKPIFPILPSVINVEREIKSFISKGRFAFFDEVEFGNALGKTFNVNPSKKFEYQLDNKIQFRLNEIIQSKIGYLNPQDIQTIFNLLNFPMVKEVVIQNVNEIDSYDFTYPVVAKVVGPIHKTDVGGVRLNIKSKSELSENINSLLQIKDAYGVLIQPMLNGLELFVGVKKEGNFGHNILCGMGGIMIEIFKDVSIGIAPLHSEEIQKMINKLKSFEILKGVRGKKGINIEKFADIIAKVSLLTAYMPNIAELDINPLLADENQIIAVDARIRIE